MEIIETRYKSNNKQSTEFKHHNLQNDIIATGNHDFCCYGDEGTC